MNWTKNSYGGYRNEEDTRYIQQTPNKFYRVFTRNDDKWMQLGPAFATAADARVFAEEI